jgi:hypothetical protein
MVRKYCHYEKYVELDRPVRARAREWLKHAVVGALLEISMVTGNSGLYFTVTSLVLFLVGMAASPIVYAHQLMASPVQMY